ncbi:MAG: DNA/RNA nuclease SfsA [Rhodobacteraceae bacterium]|nr:DNA/RNA nuclease SfsA [Paracoccaceae bacterium]
MQFQTPLVAARLRRRYKRFLADMVLEDSGREVTAHCPNPGAMLGLAEPGMRCWLEPAAPGRKLPFAWRLVELPGGHMAGIDTMVPNRVVAEALRAGRIAGLAGHVRPEVRYGERSRVDFLLTGADGARTWIEVKNVHLRRAGDWAEFPDCVTARGARHLAELAGRVAAGDCALMLYLVQRSDCARLRLASDLDPAYAAAFDAARAAGVAARAFAARLDTAGVTLGPEIAVDPGPQSAPSGTGAGI